jgi:exodeoxyribonuclease III
MGQYKLLSWNVNGIRAIAGKGFLDWFRNENADIVCIQETKAQNEQIPADIYNIEGYFTFFDSHKEKKGYSGVGLFSKMQPSFVGHGLDNPKFDGEGRIIEAHYPEFILYGIYFPNGGTGDERLRYKLDFYEAFLQRINRQQNEGKKIVITGDINTAHKEIDLARPKENVNVSGFMPIEREWIDKLTASGFIDTFRMFHPEGGQYTYWDQRFRARDRNVGWRIDYFFVSENLKPNVKDAFIEMDVMGSDHCPIGLVLEF